MEQVHHELIIPDALDGKRLDQALASLLPQYSRSRLKEWIVAGQVLLAGQVVPPRTRVTAGQNVVVEASLESRVRSAAEPLTLNIVHEDADLIVIDKPAGLVVHPGAGNPAGTLLNGLLHHAPELEHLPRAGLLHRLDKDTSGLLLIARSLRAHTALVAALQERRITREYRAVCVGQFTAGGTVDVPIGRHATQRTRMAVTDRGKPAVTHYRLLRRFDAHSLLAVRLESGRTHQIRVHMAHIKHPLVGDPVYGGRLRLPAGASEQLIAALRGFNRQALHAARLSFIHPVTEAPLAFQSPLPADLRELLAALALPEAGSTDYDELLWPEPQHRSR